MEPGHVTSMNLGRLRTKTGSTINKTNSSLNNDKDRESFLKDKKIKKRFD